MVQKEAKLSTDNHVIKSESTEWWALFFQATTGRPYKIVLGLVGADSISARICHFITVSIQFPYNPIIGLTFIRKKRILILIVNQKMGYSVKGTLTEIR